MISVDDRLWVAARSGWTVLDHGRWHVFDTQPGFRATAMRHVIRRHDDGCACRSPTSTADLLPLGWDSVSELRDHHLGDGALPPGGVYFLGEDSEQRLWIGTGDRASTW